MLDDRFDDQLRDAARDYNAPPETPRDEIWDRIVAARTDRADESEKAVRSVRYFRPLALAAGIAALLGLGVELGRLTVHTPQPVAVAPSAVMTPKVSAAAYQLATTEHLGQAEIFLTLFRASVRQDGGGNERLASATARELLASNRLLLDSPAAKDARTRALLQDLELVLAEIAQLSPQPRSRDLELIKEGLDQGGVISRLRIAVPAGGSTTQGAL
ncbi:MAG TPA: hypothetical protein VFH40_09065 [Gemmatimonadales bacterium]|jgi:hypothetical protein|nr:hypothetical protein [Gemmatimonadales bacterium]